MLIAKSTFAANDVVSIKLSNGDEIIARVEEDTVETIKIKKPLAVTIGPQGLGMMPWMFLAGGEVFTLNKSHVYAVSLAKKEAAAQYMQGTTGLAIP